MARIPIYQMSFGQNKESEKGLIFSSELPEYSMQSIIFTIPIPSNFHHPMEFEDYFYLNTFFFPFSLNDEYLELDAKVNFPEMIFNVPNTDFQITFDIDIESFYNWRYFPFRIRKNRMTKYVGEKKNLIYKNDGFLTLLPTDIVEMDELYLKHKGIFVGLTPNFGNTENINTQQ